MGFSPKHQHPCFLQHLVNFGSYRKSLLPSLLLGIQAHRWWELCFTRSVACRARVDPCRIQVAWSRRFVCHICSEWLGYVVQRGLLLVYLHKQTKRSKGHIFINIQITMMSPLNKWQKPNTSGYAVGRPDVSQKEPTSGATGWIRLAVFVWQFWPAGWRYERRYECRLTSGSSSW